MGDGAHLGVNAKRALDSVLGGAPQPTDDERMSDEDFARWVRECPDSAKGASYESTARYAARLVLEFLEANAEHRATPTEAEGEW